MRQLNTSIVYAGILLIVQALLFQACSTDVGGNEDVIPPVVTIEAITDANDADGEIIGEATIHWTTDEPNPSTVDIFLSSDSGANYDITIALNAPDTGAYVWDTNTVRDCRSCRLRIIATDVVGNVSEPGDSSEDFVINNVPNVISPVLFIDNGLSVNDKPNDGVGPNDQVVVSFDKLIDIRSPLPRDIQLLVNGDLFGADASVTAGPLDNQLTVTLADSSFDITGTDPITDYIHLHLGGTYIQGNNSRTFPSGLDVIEGLPLGTITAKDTGRTAEPLAGVDIAPTFGAGDFTGLIAGSAVAVALADFDGDELTDAVLINKSGDQSVYKYGGSSAFVNFPAGLQVLGDVNNTSVVVGDVDNSNGPDIIVGNTGANLVYYNNNNDGDFVTRAPVLLGNSSTNAVALGNIDDVPGVDLVVANNGANRVWRNDGSGNFSEDSSPQMLGTNDTRAIKLSDIDNDNDLDIISGNSGANRVWLNNGSGVFTDSLQALGGDDTLSLAVGDVDGDGDMDFVTGNENVQVNRVWINDGAGVFSDSGQSLGINRAFSIELADVDGDADLDVITGNDNDSDRQNRVWFNDGTGVFADSSQVLGTNKTRATAIADFDSDGDVDFFEGISDISTASIVWLNSQRHSAQPILLDSKQQLGTNDTQSVATGDVDNDGDQDIVAANLNQGNRVWLNDGLAVFQDSGQSLGTGPTRKIGLADVNSDGNMDMVTANEGGVPNRVLLNDGTGVFADTGQALGASDTISLDTGDIDNDGHQDIVTANLGEPNKVWRNAGNGIFAEIQSLGSALTLDIVLGDVDGDADLDIVAGNISEPDQVWLNSGFNTGVFVADQSLSSGTNTSQAITLGDIDNDDDLDLIVGGSSTDILVWSNNGTTSNMFTGPALITNTGDVRTVQLIDIDKDGDLDLLVAKFNGDNDLFLNNGNGVFSPGQIFDDNDSASIAAADLDADGDIDVVTGNSGGQSNHVWLNDF